MLARVPPRLHGLVRPVVFAAGGLLALAVAVAAPSTTLLPGPHGLVETLVAAAALSGAFAVGAARPLESLYGLVLLTVVEGAIRKWIVNDITIFLLKDMLALGIYAAVLPAAAPRALRRPWWLVAPLAGIVLLAILSVPLTAAISQAAVGLRSYVIYLPLLWVAPLLLTTQRRVSVLLIGFLTIGAIEAVFTMVQALAGPGVLNKLVSGSLPGMITLSGVAYIRPTGTFMQTGVMAAFLFFAVLAALSVVAIAPGRRLRTAGFSSLVLLTSGVVYGSARSLLGSLLLLTVPTIVYLMARRRFARALGIPAAFAAGLVLVLGVVPAVRDAGARSVEWLQDRDLTTVAVEQLDGRRIVIRIERDDLPRLDECDARLDAKRLDGTRVVVRITRPCGGQESQRVAITAAAEGSSAPGGGFLGRAADFNKAGGKIGIWGGRIRPQLDLIADQRLVGHGTGTLSLGSGYAVETVSFQGEGMYSKLAWELGLPGFALFAWFLVALLVLAFKGVLRARDWECPVAGVALGVAAIMPLWYLFTFALDFPIVGISGYLFAGCAIWYAVRPSDGDAARPRSGS